ncbi:hypothetical protein V6N13_089730 [Hibiscus sabdariffa]|uniref:F-box domain-containing protein n=1 Tax=Hibiscus sabdariffa TaxID=183260 RepID=A0ABR2QJ37_9ROSI
MSKKRNFSQVTDSEAIDSFELSERFSEPNFLRKVLLEELGDNGGGIHKLLAVTVHAVLIESGFVRFDPVSGLQTDRFRFPDEFHSPFSLCYSLPALLRANLTDYVLLRFLSVGRFIQIYGSLVKGSWIHRLSLDEHRFSPTLDLVRANSCKKDGQGSLNFSLENHVMELWRIVKDGLALPLLTDLCSETHLPVPACFVRLPTELKFKILESLPGNDIARLECVCSEMRYLASGNDLWKRKVEQEFGVELFEAYGTIWKRVFGSRWKERKKRREMRKKRSQVEPRYFPTVPSYDHLYGYYESYFSDS